MTPKVLVECSKCSTRQPHALVWNGGVRQTFRCEVCNSLNEVKMEMAQVGASTVAEYLNSGMLLEILRNFSTGPKREPKVWLYRHKDGHIAHTWDPAIANLGTDVVGGVEIPVDCLTSDRRNLFPGRRELLLSFMGSVGAEGDDAQAIYGRWVASVPE